MAFKSHQISDFGCVLIDITITAMLNHIHIVVVATILYGNIWHIQTKSENSVFHLFCCCCCSIVNLVIACVSSTKFIKRAQMPINLTGFLRTMHFWMVRATWALNIVCNVECVQQSGSVAAIDAVISESIHDTSLIYKLVPLYIFVFTFCMHIKSITWLYFF